MAHPRSEFVVSMLAKSLGLLAAALGTLGGLAAHAQAGAGARASLRAHTNDIETSCFRLKLPAGFIEGRREKLDAARPWIGAWTYHSSGRRQRISVRCSLYRAGVFRATVDRNLSHLAKRVQGFKKTHQLVEIDEKKREVAMTMGTGKGHVRGEDTGALEVVDMMFARIFKRHKARNIQVAITVAAAADRADEGSELVELVNDSFRIFSPQEKALTRALNERPLLREKGGRR